MELITYIEYVILVIVTIYISVIAAWMIKKKYMTKYIISNQLHAIAWMLNILVFTIVHITNIYELQTLKVWMMIITLQMVISITIIAIIKAYGR